MEELQHLIDSTNNILWGYVMIVSLIGCALYFTIRSRFVQFTMLQEMFRQLTNSAERERGASKSHISPFQAFAV